MTARLLFPQRCRLCAECRMARQVAAPCVAQSKHAGSSVRQLEGAVTTTDGAHVPQYGRPLLSARQAAPHSHPAAPARVSAGVFRACHSHARMQSRSLLTSWSLRPTSPRRRPGPERCGPPARAAQCHRFHAAHTQPRPDPGSKGCAPEQRQRQLLAARRPQTNSTAAPVQSPLPLPHVAYSVALSVIDLI